MYDVQNVIIDGLIVQGFQLDGINAHDSVGRSIVRNCKIRGNGRSGLSVGGASRVQVDGSVIGSNQIAQVRSEGFCTLYVTDCRLLVSPVMGPAFDKQGGRIFIDGQPCLLYTSPSPRDRTRSRMPSSA